ILQTQGSRRIFRSLRWVRLNRLVANVTVLYVVYQMRSNCPVMSNDRGIVEKRRNCSSRVRKRKNTARVEGSCRVPALPHHVQDGDPLIRGQLIVCLTACLEVVKPGTDATQIIILIQVLADEVC